MKRFIRISSFSLVNVQNGTVVTSSFETATHHQGLLRPGAWAPLGEES